MTLDFALFLSTALSMLAGLTLVMLWLRWDAPTMGMVLLAAGFYLVHLVMTRWVDFAVDPLAHMQYVQYLREHWALPTPGKEGPAYRHPPLYYALCAVFYGLGAQVSDALAVLLARLVTFGFYLGLAVYGVLIARLMLRREAGYWVALTLMLFWPLAPTMAARISCDTPLHMCTVALLYYLLRWRQGFDHRWLAYAIGCVAAGLLFKNTMIAWFGILGGYAGVMWLRGHFQLKALWRRDVVWAVVLMAACAALTLGRGWIFSHTSYRSSFAPEVNTALETGMWQFSLWKFFLISLTDIYNEDSRYLFWNMFLRTLILDQFPWKSDEIAVVVAVLLLTMLLYQALALPGLLWRGREWRAGLGVLVWASVMLVFMLEVTWLYLVNPYYANARYAYALVVIISVVQGVCVQWQRERGQALLAGLGTAMGLGFALASMALVVANYI